MRVDESIRVVIDSRRSGVHLQVNRLETVVRIVLMTADEQASLRFDPFAK